MATTPRNPPSPPQTRPGTLFNQGLRFHQAGDLAQAEHFYRNELADHANHADSLHLLGMIAFERGDLEAATLSIRKAIAVHPSAASFHANLGNILQKQGLAREAGTAYLQALTLQPNLAETHANLASLFLEAGQFENAVTWYRRALALNPTLPSAHRQLGDALRRLRLDEASEAYNQAIALQPEDADAHNWAGRVRREMGDLDGALMAFRAAQAINPVHPRACFEEALVLLLQGDLTAGWQAYERRWNSDLHATPARRWPVPQWAGQPLETGAVLLWPEQGVGDEIMFAGHIPDVLSTRTPCILACDRRLQPLFARSFPTLQVIPDTPPPPDTPPELPATVTAHLPIGSLPGLFPHRAPSAPYLRPDPTQKATLRARYADGRRVIGLAWHSKDPKTGATRSLDLAAFAPLFAQPGNRWISLQYGDAETLAAEAASASAPLLLDRTVDQLTDLDAFAAQIAAMDLVLTIDNTTAHLAGALGVPVWLILPFAVDWRWLAHGETSRFYPSMRLFRQPTRGDWPSVIAAVQHALQSHG